MTAEDDMPNPNRVGWSASRRGSSLSTTARCVAPGEPGAAMLTHLLAGVDAGTAPHTGPISGRKEGTYGDMLGQSRGS